MSFVVCGLIPIRAAAADTTPPAILSVLPAQGTIGSLTEITVTFSESVTGVVSSDLLIGGNPAVAISGSNDVYTFTLAQQPGYGTVQVSWDPGHGIYDLADPPNRFNESAPESSWQYNLVDSTPPQVASLTPAAGTTVRSLSQIEVRFSEDVTDVQASDLLINGAAATTLTALSQSRYIFQFLPPTNGTVQVSWATNHNIRDLSAAANPLVQTTWSYTLDPNFALPNIRINEFLASNISGLLDEDNEPEDWIEILNRGSNSVNLAGYSLTDDFDDPGKWVFPSTNLASGQYLVLFASGKDRRAPPAGRRFHTNFKLNPSGSYLALYNAESPRVALSEFSPEFPEQRNDNSYGYGSSGALGYFSPPTPGATNGGTLITGIVSPPHFNVERGLFDNPFTLILNTATPGATIRYTTNGSDPTISNSVVYASPMVISNTTVLRAVAFATNLIPSKTITHSYLFIDQVIRQPSNQVNFPNGPTVMAGYPSDYEMDPEITTNALWAPLMRDALKSLPVISIVCSSNDMFGSTQGIYTHPTSRGTAWERPCSFELFSTDGSESVQANAGIQIQGNAARDPQKQPKHPLRVVFKGDYGPSRLKHQIFPDSPLADFDTLILRADFNNSWLHWDSAQRTRGQRTRDAWIKDSMRALGDLATHNRYTHLYINGVYWGIYDPSERPDASFAASYLGGEKEQYDVVNEPIVNGNTAVDGDLVAYNQMLAITNLADNAQYDLMKQYLDVTQFIDYMLLHFYVGHQDWGADKNFYAIRKREPGAGFKYLPWDGENILQGTTDNRVSGTDVPSGLHPKLVANAQYKLDFADRVQKHFFNNGGIL